MGHLPQNCMFRYLGFDDGVDMPLKFELVEFGGKTIGAAWGQNVSAAPFNRLFHLTGGTTGEILMNRRRFHLKTGRLYLIPLQTPFRMRFFPPGAFGFVHFTTADAEGLDIFREVKVVKSMRTPHWLKAMLPLIHPSSHLADSLSMSAAYLAAIAEFTRIPDIESRWLHASVVKPLRNVLTLIRKRNSAALRVGEIAALAGMSPAALSQAFRRAFGHSLKFHLTQDLLQRAMRDLTGTNKTVRQIAADLNYRSASYFERAFRRVLGMSPLIYRSSMHHRNANRQLSAHLYDGVPPEVTDDLLHHAISPRRKIGRKYTNTG